MPDREQQLVEAAMRYLELLRQDQIIGINAFVATVDPALREELADYLQDVVHTGMPAQPIVLSAEEQAMAERVAARVRERHLARVHASSVRHSLADLRKEHRLSLGALAQRMNLPIDLLARIERGGVIVATIPDRLVARLATILDHTEAQIRAALSAPTALASPPRLSAADGTVVEQEHAVSFAEALAASTATPAQRVEWDEVTE